MRSFTEWPRPSLDLAPVSFSLRFTVKDNVQAETREKSNKLRGHSAERFTILTKTQNLRNNCGQYQRDVSSVYKGWR
jgi:hypothetical protein